jgi:hypothetical protein
MSGDRQLVREAVAAYFGGQLQTADAGIYYQGGALASSGLGTAFPYKVKKGAPDSYYTQGQLPGVAWGAVLTVSLAEVRITRRALAGPVSGWRDRNYRVTCDLEVLSYEPHLEIAEEGLDNLIDALIGLIYADRTLGTTNATLYPATGRLITQAGEAPSGISVGQPVFTVQDDRGRARGGVEITFDALTMVMA